MIKVYYERITDSDRVYSEGYIVTLDDLLMQEENGDWTIGRSISGEFKTFSDAWVWLASRGELEKEQVDRYVFSRRRQHTEGSIGLPVLF